MWTNTEDGEIAAFPDTVVGTDSHTTMINGLGVLGWGVGGIEAEAAMLGQPISMLIPEVVGFRLTGQAREGVTATDPGADRHADAAQEGRGRKICGILRRRTDSAELGGPRHHRQHGAGIWRHLRLLPDRRETLRYLNNAARARNRVALVEQIRQGAGPVARTDVRPIRSSPTCCGLDLARSSRRWPVRCGPKTGWR